MVILGSQFSTCSPVLRKYSMPAGLTRRRGVFFALQCFALQ
jgi:hypothetical protein